jgi:ABC-type sugar transport system substrate-binding protein
MGTVPSIFIDNSQGIKDLVSHLVLEHKAKRIAFIKGPDDNLEAKARFSAYIDALAAHNLAFDPQLVAPGTFFTGSGEKAVKLFFDQRKIVCDAIIAGNDLTAIDALNALRGRGIRVPQDVALAGFDNVKESRYIRPQLTTVYQPFMELGYEAVKMLVARLRGDEAPEQKILPTHLRIRESCGCSYKSRYSGLPLPAGKKKQPTAEPWKKCREKAIHKMEQAVRAFYTDAACARQELGWIKDIVEDFTRYLSGAGEDAFLNTFGKYRYERGPGKHRHL